MNPGPTPFYLDWTFWAAAIAVLALVLSQLPPLRVFLRRTALTLQPYDRLNVTHWLGNPNVILHVHLTNTGGRPVRVVSLALEITREGGAKVTLPAQTFSRADGREGSLILTPFSVEPDKEWANFITFFAPFAAADERDSKRLIKDLRSDIYEKILQQPPAARERKEFVEAEDARVQPLQMFFHARRFWQPGDYTATLAAHCKPTRASVVRRFRFTLFESDVQELDDRTLRYKYGFGTYLNDPDQTEVYPWIKDLH